MAPTAPARILLSSDNTLVGCHIISQVLSSRISIRVVDTTQAALNTVKRVFSDVDEAQLQLAVVPDKIAPGAFNTALNSPDIQFDTIIHTISVDFSVYDKDLTGVVRVVGNLIRNAADVALRVRRLIIVVDGSRTPGHWPGQSWRRAAGTANQYNAFNDWWTGIKQLEDYLRGLMHEAKPHFDLVTIYAPTVYGPLMEEVDREVIYEAGNGRIWDCFLNAREEEELPPDDLYYFIDVRDLAFATIQAALVPEASNQNFILCAGSLLSQKISDVLRARVPGIPGRVPRTRSSSAAATPVPQRIDSTPASAILGLVRYLSVEETLSSLGQQLMACAR
ncbi:hypothetical protein M501DRAFT_988024 [Patellaria atrata CBS 101060]|uniref:NAD(P)-binding protein n=1 Tax=Patellaria atrata CBS 101060 TaxID=1346257 RepID=A0A9P4VJW1_9PEZI|nr:hypothetical protein M501DRAFT_988024 [Patellaria atrata CBS 101060]